MGTIHDCSTAKKDVFAYFKERINHRSALNFNANDIIEYQTFTTNMNTSLESAVASISFSFDDMKQIYSTFMAQSNLNVKNILIDAIVPLKYIIDSNITAYTCYMENFSNMIPMQFNKMTTIQKKTYRSLMVSKTAETSEFVLSVQKLIALIEKKLDFCTGKSLDNELCLNNYVSLLC